MLTLLFLVIPDCGTLQQLQVVFLSYICLQPPKVALLQDTISSSNPDVAEAQDQDPAPERPAEGAEHQSRLPGMEIMVPPPAPKDERKVLLLSPGEVSPSFAAHTWCTGDVLQVCALQIPAWGALS